MRYLISTVTILCIFPLLWVYAGNGIALNGVVLDETGNPLPGVQVVVTHTETGEKHTSFTEENGVFIFKGLPSGEYSVVATIAGFTTFERDKVQILNNQTRTLQITLEVLCVDEVVAVTAGSPMIDTRSTSIGVNINREFTERLPSHDSFQTAFSFAVGSKVTTDNLYLFDGTDSMNHAMGGIVSAGYIGEQGNEFNTEEYDFIEERRFETVIKNPLSTFSIDVDTASYSNIRRYLHEGMRPPKDAVRIEEMINYFTYNYPEPTGEHPIKVVTEISDCPWQLQHKLVRIGIKGRCIKHSENISNNLVFLIDVSGSMDDPYKLPLLKEAFSLLVNELKANDRIAIVVYAGSSGLVLNSTPGSDKAKIMAVLDNLEAGGSTAGGEGIKLAYKIAHKNFIDHGNNRVILATDGDFNVGVTSNAKLVRLIESCRDDGVFLTVLGFGTGNYKDSKMEKLADKGNGNYAYIDSILEAEKVLVTQLGATMITIAKDVKIQVEFNPFKVQSYRLIGYENRHLHNEDFDDDTKDAGEMGSGSTVTALYELVMVAEHPEIVFDRVLKYQELVVKPDAEVNGEIMTVFIRYKDPDVATSKLIEHIVFDDAPSTAGASHDFHFTSAVTQFGMILRDSKYLGDSSIEKVITLATSAQGEDRFHYRQEFIDLITMYSNLEDE